MILGAPVRVASCETKRTRLRFDSEVSFFFRERKSLMVYPEWRAAKARIRLDSCMALGLPTSYKSAERSINLLSFND